MTFKELLSIVTDDTHVKAEVELKTPFGRKVVSENRTKIMWAQTFTYVGKVDSCIGDLEVESVIPECSTDDGKIGLTVRLFVKGNVW